MKNAKGFDYEGVPTKVLSAEHLAAICVDTNRMKDKLRVEMFLRSSKFDKKRFEDVLVRNKLDGRFAEWNLI